MARRGIPYDGDPIIVGGNPVSYRFTTSAGRWFGSSALATPPVANLRNVQVRKVVIEDRGPEVNGIRDRIRQFEVMYPAPADFAAVVLGAEVPADYALNGEPLPALGANNIRVFARKIAESRLDVIERGQ